MKTHSSVFLAFLVCIFCSISAFSQDTDDKQSKTQGPRKISGPTHQVHVEIDEEAISASVEVAVEQAMKTMEQTLNNIDIQIPQIDIDLSHINVNPVMVNVPDLDIHIAPIPDIHIAPITIPDIQIDIQPIRIFNGNPHHIHHDRQRDRESDEKKKEGLKKLN